MVRDANRVKIRRREALSNVGKAIVVLVVAGAASTSALFLYQGQVTPTPQQKRVTVKYAVVSRATSQAAVEFFAEQYGIWEKNALDVDLIPAGSAPNLLQMVATGETPIGQVSFSSAVIGVSSGLPIKIVAQTTRKLPFVIIVRSDSPIRNVSDLKGAKIGITRVGAITWMIPRAIISAQGLNPDRDITLIPLGELDAQVAALLKGDTDGFVWTIDAGYSLEEKGQAKILLETSQYFPDYKDASSIIVNVDFANKEPETVKRVLGAYFEAVKLMKEKPQDAARFVANMLQLSESSAEKILSILDYKTNGIIDKNALESVINILAEYEIIKSKPSISQLIMEGFV